MPRASTVHLRLNGKLFALSDNGDGRERKDRLLFIVAHVRNHKCQDVVFLIRLNETTKQNMCVLYVFEPADVALNIYITGVCMTRNRHVCVLSVRLQI